MNWISVEEGLPKTDEYGESDWVLVSISKFGDIGRGCSYRVASYQSDRQILNHNGKEIIFEAGWYDVFDSLLECDPDYNFITHWMPIPDKKI